MTIIHCITLQIKAHISQSDTGNIMWKIDLPNNETDKLLIMSTADTAATVF